MSETVARQRSSIDLDDFERRFRETARPAQGSAYSSDDPLAELARIVGDEPDPYANVFEPPAGRAASMPADFRQSFAPHGRQEPSFGEDKPRFSADFAAIEAGLRGALAQSLEQPFDQQHDHLHPQVAPGHDAQPDYAEPDYAFPPEPLQLTQENWTDPASAPAARGGKRGQARKPAMVIAGSIAIAVVGIGVAFAYKGSGSSPREIKTIMAAAGPTKIQPPADAKADAADQDGVTLGQGQPAPTKLVSREEQPVDLQQAVQDNNAARDASRGTDAASVPVPPSPGQSDSNGISPIYSVQGQAPGDAAPADAAPTSAPTYSDQGFGVGMPLPKKVRSVMVKPDGTIVAGAKTETAKTETAKTEPAQAAPVAPKVEDRIGALVDGATPAALKAGRTKPAKSTTRVATAAPTPAADSTDADAAPAAKPAKAAKKAKPVKVATAETGTEQAADATDDATPEGNGAFAVQLAAPGSEADARSTTAKLLKKYSGALHGHRLGFHRADSNGKTVYRVRVSSLSKEDAASLCSKLKADGGTCFVAKN